MKKIKLGWLTCKISYKNKVFLNGEEVDGLFIPRKKIILINKNLPYEIKKKTLYHELIHAIFFAFGRIDDWDNESLVDTLANAFVTIEKDNKKSGKFFPF